MNSCYRFDLKEYQSGIFDDSVDATYIIYTEPNKERYENIVNQLDRIKPTKKVYILINRGWRNSKKPAYITDTTKDLVDCNIHIFKHAKAKNYNNILMVLGVL